MYFVFGQLYVKSKAAVILMILSSLKPQKKFVPFVTAMVMFSAAVVKPPNSSAGLSDPNP